MFGWYHYPFSVAEESISVDVSQEDGLMVYRRVCGNEKKEFVIASPGGEIIINPVEPVNLPKCITHSLLLEFEEIVLAPESEGLFYLTFPVEIGVFLKTGKDISVLDVFTQSKCKYSLYGTPAEGEVARWHRSPVYRKMPETDILKEGVMALRLINTEKEIVSVSKAVFNSYAMKLFYNDWYVTMSAEMKIISEIEAETRFSNAPIVEGMDKTLEIYHGRDIPVVGKSNRMNWGY